RLDVGALICEIARSEIGYTEQRPAEYVAVMTAAALREGFTGPLFIQGDHVQVNAKKYAVDPETELQAIRTLIDEELHAGFYNIDVETSTLVDLSQATLDAQQRVNYERAADLTKFIRDQEPEGVTVSVGAEIGEVGSKNSDVHELTAFMDGYGRALARLEGGPYTGISKISVQTGTSHGGVVLPDGSIARVQLDLDALKALSADARSKYGLGGAVQHGASTWPPAPQSRESSIRRTPSCSSSSASPARARSPAAASSRHCSHTRSRARWRWPRPTIWRPASERAGRGVRALPAGLGSGRGARVPVRARAGRGVPHQAVAQAAGVARPGGREGGRVGRAARHGGGRGG